MTPEQKSDLASEAIKAAPPVAITTAVTIGGLTLNEWVAIATIAAPKYHNFPRSSIVSIVYDSSGFICASACSLIFTIKGHTPVFAGRSPSTLRINWISFWSRFKFIAKAMVV